MTSYFLKMLLLLLQSLILLCIFDRWVVKFLSAVQLLKYVAKIASICFCCSIFTTIIFISWDALHCTALRNKDRRGGGRKQASQTEIQSISIRTPITSRDVQIIMAKDYEDDDDDAPAADD